MAKVLLAGPTVMQNSQRFPG